MQNKTKIKIKFFKKKSRTLLCAEIINTTMNLIIEQHN